MQIPVDIAWHHLDQIPHLEDRIRSRADRLERIFDRITGCSVVVSTMNNRHKTGNLYEVRLSLTLPGGELQVTGKPGDMNAHADPLVAIRDSFDAMERQLRRWKDQHKGRPDVQVSAPQGRVQQLDPDADGGQIAMTDGRLVYFHRNSVVAGDFDDLKVGDPVELVVDRGLDADGAHASTVKLISPQKFVDRP